MMDMNRQDIQLSLESFPATLALMEMEFRLPQPEEQYCQNERRSLSVESNPLARSYQQCGSKRRRASLDVSDILKQIQPVEDSIAFPVIQWDRDGECGTDDESLQGGLGMVDTKDSTNGDDDDDDEEELLRVKTNTRTHRRKRSRDGALVRIKRRHCFSLDSMVEQQPSRSKKSEMELFGIANSKSLGSLLMPAFEKNPAKQSKQVVRQLRPLTSVSA